MRILATLMLMISLVAMTVQAADARLARSSCSAELRSVPMCHAAAPVPAQSRAAKKQGACCDLFPDMPAIARIGAGAARSQAAGRSLPAAPLLLTFPPWRPPQG